MGTASVEAAGVPAKMARMRIYRPADVLAMADELRSGLADGADQAKNLVELVPRLLRLVRRAEVLLESAERTMLRTEELVTRGGVLFDTFEEVAPSALPVLGRIVEAVDPDEVRAINRLVDGLPAFQEQLSNVGPDVHRILDAVTDLSQALKGVPGMGGLIRRGERKDEEQAIEQLDSEVETHDRPVV